MNLLTKNIILTGASGGIGTLLTARLLEEGARVAAIDLDPARLDALDATTQLRARMGTTIAADLTRTEDIPAILKQIPRDWEGAVDVVIHAAGVMDFAPFETMRPESIHRMTAVNLEAPIQLTRALLPAMLNRRQGRIVFLGSILGALGMPYFSTYSASKFALRGFSQALRRELNGKGVGVSYIGPRSVKTSLNAGAVERMAKATGMTMDDPDLVAKRIVQCIERERDEMFIGFPESLFARINALFPWLIDKGMRKQQRIMEPFARES